MKRFTLMHVSGRPIRSRWSGHETMSLSCFNFMCADEIDKSEYYFRYGETWYHEDELFVVNDADIKEVI